MLLPFVPRPLPPIVSTFLALPGLPTLLPFGRRRRRCRPRTPSGEVVVVLHDAVGVARPSRRTMPYSWIRGGRTISDATAAQELLWMRAVLVGHVRRMVRRCRQGR